MAADNEDRLYDPTSGDKDLLNDENFDYRTAGARLLGRDVLPLLNPRDQFDRFENTRSEYGSMDKLIDIVNQNRRRDGDSDELTRTIFCELAIVISDR